MAVDDEGLWVGELDFDVLGVNARKLALQGVGRVFLGDVELGVEGLDA